MNLKVVALGAVVVLILLGLGLALRKGGFLNFGAAGVSGFANPTLGGTTFTMYYADWCPHCQSAKPAFKEWSDKGEVTVGGKRCAVRMISSEENPDVMKEKNITGFPTFLLETADGKREEYKGARTVDGYVAFLNEKLGGGI